MKKTFILGLLMLLTSHALAGEIFVAVNKSNNSDINQQQVFKILTAKNLAWDDGSAIVLLIDDLQYIKSSAFDEFLDMSKSQFIEFWRIKFFSGRALIPTQIKSTADAIRILSENKNSIYVIFGMQVSKELRDRQDLKVINLIY